MVVPAPYERAGEFAYAALAYGGMRHYERPRAARRQADYYYQDISEI